MNIPGSTNNKNLSNDNHMSENITGNQHMIQSSSDFQIHSQIEEKEVHTIVDKCSIGNISGDIVKNTTFVPNNEIFQLENNKENFKINETIKRKHKIRKRITLADSDSEDEILSANLDEQTDALGLLEYPSDSNAFTVTSEISVRKRTTVLHSDSDEEENSLVINKEHKNQNRLSKFQDSDSDADISEQVTNYSSNSKIIKKKFNFSESDSDNENDCISFGDEKDVQSSYNGEVTAENSEPKRSNWRAICDSESSGPEDKDEDNDKEKKSVTEKEYNSEDEIIKPIKYKKKKMSKEDSKQMTAKQAAKQRDEIRSESQRMLRESNISLPYHRPKTFTLKEFLSRRPKFASAVPIEAKTPPSIAIKMSTQQLEVITKKMEERHKEVKEFYKSDSEPEDLEDKDDEDYVPLESDQNEDGDKNEEVDKIEESDKNEEGDKSEEGGKIENGDQNKNDTNKEVEEKEKGDKNNESNDESTKNFYHKLVLKDKPNTEKVIGNNQLLENEEKLEISKNSSDNKDNSDGKKIKIISEYIVNEISEKSPLTERNNLNEETKNKDYLKQDSNSEIKNDIIMEEPNFNNESAENTGIVYSQSSPKDFDFNLDDLEENSEMVSKNEIEKQAKVTTEASETVLGSQSTESVSENFQSKFTFGEIDMEIENFGSAEPPVLKKPKSKLDLLKERLSNIRPRLSGGPNHTIDLENVAKPDEVSKLMLRFAQHTAKKVLHKDKVKLNIVSVEQGGEIHKETVALNIDDEEDLVIEEKPGVRLQRLRNELQTQIAQKKSEIWQQRAATKEKNTAEIDPYDGEKSECGTDDAILDNDDEEEMSESSEEEEEEMEEDIVEDIPTAKSVFVDDEAEESENEELGLNQEATVSVSDKSENEEDLEDLTDDDNENEDKNVEKETTNSGTKINEEKDENLPFKKPLKRIVKGFTEDSDEEDYFGLPGDTIKKIAEKLNRSNEDSINTQDDYIRPYQLQNQNDKTPIKSFVERSNSELKFLTPVSYITGLQNLTNSASKANVPSPLREIDWHAELQKKLNADSIITMSQAEAMRNLCSEEFSESQDSLQNSQEIIKSNTKSTSIPVEIPPTLPSSTQDILNVCSGTFDQSTSCDVPLTLPPSTPDLLNVCSGKFTGESQVFESIPSSTITHKFNAINEVKTLGEDQDMIISQLINEEEMEAFKKKFDSPILAISQQVTEEAEEVAGGGIIDSDEDEDVLGVKKKKRNQKKLTFSDDEDSDEEKEKEEEIELQDDIEKEDEENIPLDEINYDSEENEVEFTADKGKSNIKMTDFFEDEAELSESEWGSADEDEKDLDTLDFEQADKEKFDEKQLKTDLEKIHMRRMLDDDTREVKLLQEMLLDDGELYGSGRERQFKWKNIDSGFTGDEEKKESDDENHIDDDESEEQWRRKRHEREMFLKEKKSQETGEDVLNSSDILKIGHKFIQRSISNSSNIEVSVKNPSTDSSPALKRSFSLMHKRGSFLNRSDQVLQRLAEYNKTAITATVVAGKAKNSKNFLFQTVAQESVTTSSFANLKRKAADGTPKAIKKLRLTDNFSPALERKKRRDKQIKAKLFGVS